MITVHLPFITKNNLNGSQGRSFTASMVKARRRKQQREGTHLMLMRKAEPARAWLKVGGSIEVTVTRVSPGELDQHDGLRAALKAVVDGVTDALGLKTDKHPQLKIEYAQLKAKNYSVRVDLRAFGSTGFGDETHARDAIEALDAMHPPPKPPGEA
jgi:hypothetical protein